MKNFIKKKASLIALTIVLVLAQLAAQAMPVFAEETGYTVSFVAEHATIDTFYSKNDYSTPYETGVSSTVVRTNGEVDTSGDGQVNFRVNVEDGYEIVSVTADAHYKNLKGSSDTGVEGIYRLTKITGNVTVTVVTKEKSDSTDPDQGTTTPTTPDPTTPTTPSAPVAGSSNIVINEVESNGDATDWVEIYNKGTEAVDISGWYVTDDHTDRLTTNETTPLPEGTTLGAGEYYVFDKNINFSFGLGAPDEVNLYDKNGNLVEKYSWSTHATGTYARIPDGTGSLIDTSVSTKGSANQSVDDQEPTFENAIEWPGSAEVITYDDGVQMFKSDSSGLDFSNDKLYAIDNKKGTFWVLDVALDGTITYADGFTSTGKNLAFKHDAADPENSNPDSEGITVDGNGMAYAAVERDNNNKTVNYNAILQFDPWENASTVVAKNEWDITSLLPDVPANSGIEAVEWVANANVSGKIIDQNTGAAFDPANYPNAIASGVFFVAFENNGHVYALVLNNDETAVLIADIDTGLGCAMALDYDTYENVLWVGADDTIANHSAKLTFNGTSSCDITIVKAPAGMDTSRNNEGFAIADAKYTVNGLRPVYHFMDGQTTGVLTIAYLRCDYIAQDDTDPDDGKEDSGNDGNDDNSGNGSESGNQTENNTQSQENQSENIANTSTVNQQKVTGSVTTPQTGDETNLMVWGVVLATALGIAATAAAIKKFR